MARSKRLTKEQLALEPEKQLKENTRESLKKFWTGLQSAMDRGDRWAFELVSRTYAYDKGPGGVTIYNQHLSLNQSAATDSPARVKSFDQIIAKLEERDAVQRQLAAPLENSDPDNDDDEEDDGDGNGDSNDNIPEAEFEDVPVAAGE